MMMAIVLVFGVGGGVYYWTVDDEASRTVDDEKSPELETRFAHMAATMTMSKRHGTVRSKRGARVLHACTRRL